MDIFKAPVTLLEIKVGEKVHKAHVHDLTRILLFVRAFDYPFLDLPGETAFKLEHGVVTGFNGEHGYGISN